MNDLIINFTRKSQIIGTLYKMFIRFLSKILLINFLFLFKNHPVFVVSYLFEYKSRMILLKHCQTMGLIIESELYVNPHWCFYHEYTSISSIRRADKHLVKQIILCHLTFLPYTNYIYSLNNTTEVGKKIIVKTNNNKFAIDGYVISYYIYISLALKLL